MPNARQSMCRSGRFRQLPAVSPAALGDELRRAAIAQGEHELHDAIDGVLRHRDGHNEQRPQEPALAPMGAEPPALARRGGFSPTMMVRPSGLEPPRTVKSTRPSTSFPMPYAFASVQIVRSVRVCGRIGRNDLCQRCVTAGRRGARGRRRWLTEATGAVASLPARAGRPHVSSLDASRARQGAAAWLRAPGCRVGAARRPPRAEAQQGLGALAPQLRASCDRVRVSGWRGSARCADCDRVAAALACVHEDRRALRRCGGHRLGALRELRPAHSCC
jgi:hypothetical protein